MKKKRDKFIHMGKLCQHDMNLL